MFKVTKQMRTETAHRLAGHPGRCRFIHGHSYLWEITVESSRLEDGMVIDFSNLKAVMIEVIDLFDHALVLQDVDPLAGAQDELLAHYGLAERLVIVPYRPTAEQMAQEVAKAIKDRLDLEPGARVIVKLWETSTSYVEVSW